MIPRILEPEAMDTAQEAADYDAMDHRGPNDAFATDCLQFATIADASKTMLDVGTGTALIPIAMCSRAPNLEMTGVDLHALTANDFHIV